MILSTRYLLNNEREFYMMNYRDPRTAIGAIADKIRGTMPFFAFTDNGRELQGLALIYKQLLLQKKEASYSALNFPSAVEMANLKEAQKKAVFKAGSLMRQIYGAMNLTPLDLTAEVVRVLTQ